MAGSGKLTGRGWQDDDDSDDSDDSEHREHGDEDDARYHSGTLGPPDGSDWLPQLRQDMADLRIRTGEPQAGWGGYYGTHGPYGAGGTEEPPQYPQGPPPGSPRLDLGYLRIYQDAAPPPDVSWPYLPLPGEGEDATQPSGSNPRLPTPDLSILNTERLEPALPRPSQDWAPIVFPPTGRLPDDAPPPSPPR